MDVFNQINDHWFLTEPLLFSVLCTHKLIPNRTMHIPFRCGNMKIEYNPLLLGDFDYKDVQERLKIEVIRIILKHPYQRQPFQSQKSVLTLSSTVTILENHDSFLNLPRAKDYDIAKNLSFEEYYKIFLTMIKEQQSLCCNKKPKNANEVGKSKAKDYLQELEQTAQLWEQDDFAEQIVNDLIHNTQQHNSWGNITGNLRVMIEQSLIIKLDYRRVLNSFRASVLSNERKLTRMRPSRRYGFDCMGSKREFTTHLLVAIDVSMSIENEDIQNFLSVINRFFKYGIKSIDVVQFDTEIKGEILTMKKAQKGIDVLGRGGTCFQCVYDFFSTHTRYDGLIIFTDGFAVPPTLKRNTNAKIMWVLDNEENYLTHKDWIHHLPKTRAIWIPC